MANTSATGGFLAPSSATPLYDDALNDFFQAVYVGLTGLDGTLVRPRFQVKPPKQPAASVTWCAVGVMDVDKGGMPARRHDATGDGQDVLERHEEITVLASFYGPRARELAAQTADAFYEPQNLELLTPQLMTYVNNDTIRQVSELVNEQWINRVDLSMTFRRKVVRTYAVLNLLSADTKFTR